MNSETYAVRWTIRLWGITAALVIVAVAGWVAFQPMRPGIIVRFEQGGWDAGKFHHPHCSWLLWPDDLLRAVDELLRVAPYETRVDIVQVLDRYGLRSAAQEGWLRALGLFGRGVIPGSLDGC